MIFSDTDRKFNGPKPYGESDFEYLDRSARIESERVRNTISEWLINFPKSDRHELISRLKSGDHINFLSASFELYIHEILIRLGYEISSHPSTSSEKTTRPDFLAHDARTGEQFYVEAVLATDQSNAGRAAESRKNIVIDSINKLSSPNFYLALSAAGDPKTTPSAKKLKKKLTKWLSELDPDEVLKNKEIDGNEAFPRIEITQDGWNVGFIAIPKSPERRGVENSTTVGSIFNGVRWMGTWESIRDAVLKKGNRYGDLDLPFLDAVNVGQFNISNIDVMQALYGQEQFIFNSNKLDRDPRMVRSPNGVWSGPEGVRYRRVSGVIISPEITPWTYRARNICTYINPWANLKVSGSLFKLSHAQARESAMEWIEGTHPGELLGLHEGWPE